MRRVLALLTAVLIMGATAAAVSAQGKDWGDMPPHGHVMLLGAEIDEEQGKLYFRRCVEFAAGAALPNRAHHDSVHTGAAGGSPFAQGALWNAGNIVVPLAPFGPPSWTGCESFESGMPLP
jgi:hypothetical protein